MVVSCCAIFLSPPLQYNKHQTRADKIGKCLDEGLEPTYYFSIFMPNQMVPRCVNYSTLHTLQIFSAGLQAPYRDFGVQGYQNCRGYV